MLAVETYGQDVYVASVCLEANYAQVMKAFAEAEAHKGVSLIVAYAPCVMQVSTDPAALRALRQHCKQQPCCAGSVFTTWALHVLLAVYAAAAGHPSAEFMLPLCSFFAGHL